MSPRIFTTTFFLLLRASSIRIESQFINEKVNTDSFVGRSAVCGFPSKNATGRKDKTDESMVPGLVTAV